MDTAPLKPLLVDGHEDLAYNILSFGRDYTRPVQQTRRLEIHTDIPAHNGDTLLGWPEYQSGRVGLVFATLFAAPVRRKLGEWDTLVYANVSEAFALYRQQIDVYNRLVEAHPGKFRLIRSRLDLDNHLAEWQSAANVEMPELPVGLVILMENAEGVRTPAELVDWWEWGVRLIGPAWAGTRFCGGTREPGPLTPEGVALLRGMAEHGFVLDISHMDEQAALQALDFYPHRIIASHSNALALLPDADSNRHLPDRVIDGLLERQAVIGILPANGFLLPGWRDKGGRQAVTLDHVIAQVDYICQKAGSARHVALGSDYDGGFGLESVPADVDSIADLQLLVPRLQEKGFHAADIDAIFHGNWLGVLRGSLP